jgi:ABC-2 type transport system permease protein
MTATAATPMTVVSARTSVRQRVRRIWQYRELLLGMVRKELKVKYKNSVLGFVWSMLNPAMYLVVFYVVFQLVLKNGIPNFAIFLLCGLLVWNFFSTTLPSATGSIVGNSSIIKKVSFPREVLPLASEGAALVHFFLQTTVLVLAMLLFRYQPAYSWLWLLIPALVALLLFAAACSVFLSAVNVYMRDTQHLLELLLLAWFWGTPIVYPYQQVASRLGHLSWVYLLNPITSIVMTFQRVLYNKISPVGENGVVHILPPGRTQLDYLIPLAIISLASLAFLLGAMVVFGRLEGNFAEEL